MNRYAARELVTFSPTLSAGAARLYLALDEYARESGVCWPRQRTLVSRLGCSARSLQYYLAELVKAELCSVERSTPGGPNRYRLFHSPVRNQTQSIALPHANTCATLTQPAAPLIRNNTDIETELAAFAETQPQEPDKSLCGRCHGEGKRGYGSERSNCGYCGGTGKARRSA